MSTLAQLQTKNGVAVAYLLTVSLDNFSTTFAQYSTVAFVGQSYDPRLKSVGRLQRGLQPNFSIGASTVPIELDNTDGGVDYLVTPSTVETEVLKAQFKLEVILFDPFAPTDLQKQTLGKFVCLDRPVRYEDRVVLSLADNTFGNLAELARAPSLNDWTGDSGTTASNCPLVASDGGGILGVGVPMLDVVDLNAPIRLAFGHRAVQGIRCLDAYGSGSSQFGGGYITTAANLHKRVIMVCATASTGVNAPVMSLTEQTTGTVIPTSTTLGDNPGTIWSAHLTQTLTKDGKDWKLIYIVIDYQALTSWNVANLAAYSLQLATGNPAASSIVPAKLPGWADSQWSVQCEFMSSITFTTPTVPTPWIPVSPAQVAFDLLAYYSRGIDIGAGDVDVDSFVAVTTAKPGLTACGTIDDGVAATFSERVSAASGTLRSPHVEALGGRMKQVLNELCQSGQFDITTKWDGTFEAVAQVSAFDAQTATLTALDETLIVASSWLEKTPSAGERWAPYNRIYIRDPDGSQLGPFDAKDYSLNVDKIDSWGVVLPYTVTSKWVWYIDLAGNAQNVWAGAGFEAKARPVVSFRYSLEALALEIGQYIEVTWSRGGSLPLQWSNTIARVEGLTLIPANCEVQVDVVWFGDLRSSPPYLLDNESYTVVVSSSVGRTVTVQDGNDELDFASGNLISDGVQAGDILVVLDATQAEDVFTRRRCVRISLVQDAVTAFYAGADQDWSSPGGIAVTTWEIRRGFTTYPNAGSDPTHYPSGSAMYGKVANSSGVFSDSTAANQLLDG